MRVTKGETYGSRKKKPSNLSENKLKKNNLGTLKAEVKWETKNSWNVYFDIYIDNFMMTLNF